MKILVCDDDFEIARAIGIYLGNEGYEVITAHDGIEAVNLAKDEDVKLVIMDLMLPQMDGLTSTARIRESRNIPIIMLSAKAEDYDKINGLNVGADDYITKPFNPMELVARVKANLRRYMDLGSEKTEACNIYRTGALVVDDNKKIVTIDGNEVSLTPTEYGILRLLVENAGHVFSMNEIYENVWKEPAFNPENTVAVHIRHIREKIEVNPKNPTYIKVVWGIGYKAEKID